MTNCLKRVSKHDFFVVNSSLFDDERLSLTEIGLLAYMLSRRTAADNSFTPDNIPKRDIDPKEVNKALCNLNRLGYFRKRKLINRDGNIIDWTYDVSDTYHPEWVGTEVTEIEE